VGYLHYLYQLKDTANHTNNFDVARAYLNVVGRLDAVSTRITPDIYRVADGSLAFRLKYAYLAYAPKGNALTYKLGQIQTPWVDFEETLWDFRMQGPVAMDRGENRTPFAYLSSSDFGFGVDGRWGPDRINAQIALINGEGYNRAPGDQRKDIAARVSIRVKETDDSSRVGGVRLSAYAHHGKPTGGGIRNRLLGMVSHRSRRLTLAGEVAFTRDSAATPLAAGRSGRVLSAFAVYRMPQSRTAVIGRVDLVDPNTATPGNRQTRIIAGLSYQLAPNVRLLGDIDHVTYEGGSPTPALEASRSQAFFHVQFTF
jgi:hypothetical protein